MNNVNHKKLKFKINIFKSSNKSISYKFFYNLFLDIFFIYINLSAKYYKENRERLKKEKSVKKACERYQNLSKEEKMW